MKGAKRFSRTNIYPMETHCSPIKQRLLLALSLLFCGLLAAAAPNPEYDEQEIIERLKRISEPLVESRYNSVVGGYIRSYLYRNDARKAALVTGRAVLYFPIMEAALAKHGLPEKLKYLPVVESALNPYAVSPVGATGLWQFMPGTASDYGLKVNDYLDERRDPHKSTEAAIAYLQNAYEKYGDWALALAAYNAGGGRVSRAIKRGRSKNFWVIRRYMPRETRNYVPAYIAATYLMEYYKDYGVQPTYPELEMQITETIQVYDAISFYRIAQLTGLPIETIATLNPAYKRDLLPNNPGGNYLILPKRVMPAVKDYLAAKRPDYLADAFYRNQPVKAGPAVPDHYVATVYKVREGETLSTLAKRLNCSVHQLVAWNGLRSDTLAIGQALQVYRPKSFRRFSPMPAMPALALLLPAPSAELEVGSIAEHSQARYLPDYYYCTVDKQPLLPSLKPAHLMDAFRAREWPAALKKRQRLSDFAEQFPNLSAQDLSALNGLDIDAKLEPGQLIKIR